NKLLYNETYCSSPLQSTIISIKLMLRTSVKPLLLLGALLFFSWIGFAITLFVGFLFLAFNPISLTANISTGTMLGISSLLVSLLVVFICYAVFLAMQYVIVSAMNLEFTGTIEALKKGFSRLLSALVAVAISGVIVLIGLIFFILPGIYLA